MSPEQARSLRAILAAQPLAALGTLHRDHPSVSMVPFAVLPDSGCFVIHVSTLATHTKDMQHTPQVSLLVIAPPAPDVLPQATPRVSFQAEARPIARSDERYALARAAYLARFPESEPMFDFSDFSVFAIEPTSARFVGGFAQATSLLAEAVRDVLRG
jgi:putative heme iron utilization protein